MALTATERATMRRALRRGADNLRSEDKLRQNTAFDALDAGRPGIIATARVAIIDAVPGLTIAQMNALVRAWVSSGGMGR